MPGKSDKLSQIWQELKRRKVVRVITVYAAAAFVILELVDIIAPNLGLPVWTFNLVLILICVGFIIAVILSWIYDVKPEGGIVKTEPAHKVKAEDVSDSSNSWKIASYISFVVIVALIVLNIIPRSDRSEIKEILDKSIAVLPFRNDSPDEEKMYFINGTMESILDNLCKIKDLRVPGRTSVEQYRGVSKPIPEIAAEMNVSYVLEGSGQKLGNRILLYIQLLDGRNDQHLWSKQYDREIQRVEDLIDIQSEVAKLVAAEIEAIITPEERQLIEKIPTSSLTAYDFYLRGREEYGKYSFDRDNKEVLERAEKHYHKALDYDSTFAQAYAGLAWVYKDKRFWEEILTENFLDSVLILANIALSFNDQLSEAHVIRGEYYRRHNQKEQAIKEFDKAIKINPNDWQAYLQKGGLYTNDDPVITLDAYHTAASLHRGPFLPGIYRNLHFSYAYDGFKEKAIYYNKEALKLDDDSASYYDLLAAVEEANGNFEKAIEYAEKAYTIDSTRHWVIHHLGSYHSYLGQFEESLRYFKEYERTFRVLNEPHPFGIFRIGHAYWVNGYIEEAQYFFDKGFEFFNESIELDRLYNYYSLATAYAFLGDKEKAFEILRLYNRRQHTLLLIFSIIKKDPMWDKIRDEPEFQQIVKAIEAKYLAKHERVRQWLEENEML